VPVSQYEINNLSTVTPPWKIKEENANTSSKRTNSIENQVAAIHKTISQSPPVRTNEQKTTTTSKQVKIFKVADIAKSLLTKRVDPSSDIPQDNEEEMSNVNKNIDDNQQQRNRPSLTQSEPPAKRTRRKA
ncbi:11041_t:CDS:1, partial [Paraglomus occultum]